MKIKKASDTGLTYVAWLVLPFSAMQGPAWQGKEKELHGQPGLGHTFMKHLHWQAQRGATFLKNKTVQTAW